MKRRAFSRAFKLEAVKLVQERGVSVVQAARDLDVAESVLRRWIRDASADPRQAFPGHGQMRPEQQEIDRLRREVAKLKAERDILKKATAYFAIDAPAGAACQTKTTGAPGRYRRARRGHSLGQSPRPSVSCPEAEPEVDRRFHRSLDG